MGSDIIVTGFPKCGTTALMQSFESDTDVQVLRNESAGLEITWPKIKDIGNQSDPNRITGHKYSSYIYSKTALHYLANEYKSAIYVVCIRDPRRSIVSWHNMHRDIATSGRVKEHFAYKDRDFYMKCTIDEYYQRFAKSRLNYVDGLQNVLEIIPRDQIIVVDQSFMAKSVDVVKDQIKHRALGQTVDAALPHTSKTAPHISFADKSAVTLSDGIAAELSEIWQSVHDIVKRENLTALV